ncbi:MAG: ABC transporter ATP-binding protein [Desulfovibrio sp.]|jgi:putative ABC transport system ATP-binding protein|nr:ABC transporter ATP-binding protein [Desulfovibrio sp.]
MILLRAVNLSKEFRRRHAQGHTSFSAVSKVNFSIAEGDMVTVTGRSGSGKTTLLTLLAGLASPTSGTVLFKGENMYVLSDRNLSSLRNKEISFVPQGMGLLGNVTVLDNVRTPQLFAAESGADSGRAEFLLEAVGLRSLALEYPQNLSGGEMRRVAIARALFNDPTLLIADEPTSDLDPENTRIVMELLRKANEQGTTIIVVTHEQDVARYGSIRFFMDNGELSPIADIDGMVPPAQRG